MKYVNLLVLISFLFLSCNDNTVTLSKEEYNQLKGIGQPEYPKPFHFMKGSTSEKNKTWQIILGQDDHEYIENVEGYDDLLHSPECKLCKNRQFNLPKDTL